MFNVYPILKEKYVDKGVTADFDSVMSLLRHIHNNDQITIECDGLLIQVPTDTWENRDDDMRQIQASFPLLSFQVELVPDDYDHQNGPELESWDY